MKRALVVLGAVTLAAACTDGIVIVDPPVTQTVDAQVRAEFQRWGILPIGDMPQQPAALVQLGQALMFDKILSGNRDISCATCHFPTNQLADRMSLSIGTGGTGAAPNRTLGAGRRFVPRNAPSLLDQGLRSQYIFWDGRVSGMQTGPFTTPAKSQLPSNLGSILGAQAMFPVTNREEMRGDSGDLDVFGNANELAQIPDTAFNAIWKAVMVRLLALPEYQAMFAAAFPGSTPQSLGFQHAAQAIAAFETQAFSRHDSPFDRYVARDDGALSPAQKRGALVFFQGGRCSSCHQGALLGGSSFANTGIPQIGPGVGVSAPLDRGRGDASFIGSGPQTGPFSFRVQPLRNVELTAPYMHNGAYPTLEAVVKHYDNATAAQNAYDVSQLAPEIQPLYRGDAVTKGLVLANLDFRLRQSLNLTPENQSDLVAFLKSLTDPAARSLTHLIPASVPSGLPVEP